MRFKIQDSRFNFFLFLVLFTIHCLLITDVFAAHPLITDDTGTQGRGKVQIEVNSEISYDKESVGDVTTKETGGEVATILSYGITNNIDMVFGLPYQWMETDEDGGVINERGIADISLEAKWRFLETDGLSLALKPGVTLPTGDEDKGLGVGEVTYSIFFITTKEIEPWAFHMNLGYIRNENKDDERKDIWHVSLASLIEVVKNLRIVANIGAERNPDKASNTHPAFILGGIIYSFFEDLDIDFGIKGGLNKPETDLTLLAGMALRF
ncbi:MAG: transporter [Thermodesulfovibrionia bacterium]